MFLWKKPPEKLSEADIAVQNQEPVKKGYSNWYMSETITNLVYLTTGGWLPAEWNWYVGQTEAMQTAYCNGIFGGNDLEFIGYYAQSALEILSHEGNQEAWRLLDRKMHHCATLEQYDLAACDGLE